VAVNVNRGEILWQTTLGVTPGLPADRQLTGGSGSAGPTATAGGLMFVGATNDKRFRAFDSRTGQVLWEGRLESEGHTTPMTYMAPNGKQYVVVVTTGVNAFALE
jgi:quinoprotein glucose dehydrogenase